MNGTVCRGSRRFSFRCLMRLLGVLFFLFSAANISSTTGVPAVARGAFEPEADFLIK
jgi:hypothetical protein